MWLFLLIFPAIACIALLLYRRGLAVSKSISAILFSFRPGKNCDRAALNSCTGWVRHVGRFRESRSYTFTLDAQLTAGRAEASLLDREQKPLLKLSPQVPSGTIELDGKSRYFLRWDFQSATGDCCLRWQQL